MAPTCVSIGRKSGRVFGTGGQSAAMWALGKPQPLACLEQPPDDPNSSAVTSICVDAAEERVLVGTASGAVVVWDLRRSAVTAQVLAAKGAPVRCVDFHPLGSFIATVCGNDLKVCSVNCESASSFRFFVCFCFVRLSFVFIS